jgi:hypothetical protein
VYDTKGALGLDLLDGMVSMVDKAWRNRSSKRRVNRGS